VSKDESRDKPRGPKLKDIYVESSLEEPELFSFNTTTDWSWFEDYYRKNRHEFINDWKVDLELMGLEEELGREPSEAERREIVDKASRRVARQSYPGWYRRQRDKAQEEWVDRLMKGGAPDQEEIVGLANIFEALGYSRTYAKDTGKRRKLEKQRIIYQGPDGKWRALKVTCDVNKEGRKKK
jgi:hypothetical protein